MASQIQIKVGNLTSAINSQNDQKIGNIINNYALAMGVSTDATQQQKLDFATRSIVDHMAQIAKDHQVGEAVSAAREQAETDFDWEQ